MKEFFRHLVIGSFLFGSFTTWIKAQPYESGSGAMRADTGHVILVNQVGYLPEGSKVALIRTNADEFKVVNVVTGKVAFSARTSKPRYWKYSGDTVRAADFSKLTIPGKYKICLTEKAICSYDFDIKQAVYRDVAKASIKAFYYNRCSFEITKDFGGKWARLAGHPDTVVIIHESAASGERPSGTIISSPGGWYDAGDYNKYIVNSGITVYTLLLFYQLYPDYCNLLNTNISESTNNIPDVVDEILYNLRWMLTMQDPNDGGVYHKLTNKVFDSFEMPDKALAPRYVVMKSTAATLDFAAVTAMASRVFASSSNAGLKALAQTCRIAADKAYTWANAHPDVYYKQPEDIHTGGYEDGDLADEFFWGKVELALIHNDKTRVSVSDIASQKTAIPSWSQVGYLGMISLALTDNPQFAVLKNAAAKRVISLADSFVSVSANSAYKTGLTVFHWGSNGEIANQTLLEWIAYRLTGYEKYLPAIQGNTDYILGRNATDYCFVTGFGSHRVMNIHHRPSAADGIPEPEPGFMPGGPNETGQYDCGPQAYSSKFPAKSYLDAPCSFASNEIAINWNAPLFFIMGALDAMGEKK